MVRINGHMTDNTNTTTWENLHIISTEAHVFPFAFGLEPVYVIPVLSMVVSMLLSIIPCLTPALKWSFPISFPVYLIYNPAN